MKRPFKKLTDEQLKIKLDGHSQGKENHPTKDGREGHANLERLVRQEISYREVPLDTRIEAWDKHIQPKNNFNELFEDINE